MTIQKISIENFTVFNKLDIAFSEGINAIIGENGTGKTHLLKLLYALCKFSSTDDIAGYLQNYFTPTSSPLLNDGINPTDITLYFDGLASDHNMAFSSDFMVHVPQGFPVKSTFIPAAEMLSHAKGLPSISSTINSPIGELRILNKLTGFDVASISIVELLQRDILDETPEVYKCALSIIEDIIEGKVSLQDEVFYIEKSNGVKVDVSLESDGVKKFAILWRLLMNESITAGSILFWDEPEAYINPKFIPLLVEILMELEKSDVQIFVSTHDYVMAKYLELRKREEATVQNSS